MPEYRLVQHRGNYSLAYTDAERGRIRIALGTADRGEAEARAGDLWRARTQPVSERVEHLWPAYIQDRKASGVSVDTSGSTWRALAPSFAHKLGKAVSREDCREHYARRKKDGRTDSTIRTELELLRACLRFRFGATEAPRLWMPPPSKPREAYLTREQAVTLLQHVEAPHVRLFIELAIATGARMSAILQLTWARVDLDHATVNFNPAGRAQTNKRRIVAKLNNRALRAIKEAQPAAMTDYVIEYAQAPVASIKKAIASAARRSGVPCSPHVFRHTFGVWAAEADVSMDKIAQALGTTVRIAEKHYARFSPRYLAEASEAVSF